MRLSKVLIVGLVLTTLVGCEGTGTACTVDGAEGFYYLVEPLPGLDPSLCFSLIPQRSPTGGMVGTAVLASGTATSRSEIAQIKFGSLELKECGLEFSLRFPTGTRLQFEGRFIRPDPFLHRFPPDEIVLEGRFTIEAPGRPPHELERSLTYDSGY